MKHSGDQQQARLFPVRRLTLKANALFQFAERAMRY